LNAILDSNKENLMTNETYHKNNKTYPNVSTTKSNNYITEIKSNNQNTQDRSNDIENQSIIDLVICFRKIDINTLTNEIPVKYIDLMNKMILIESNSQGDNVINKYSNQVIEKIYQNKTIKRSFVDGYTLYLYENGDIKQVIYSLYRYFLINQKFISTLKIKLVNTIMKTH